FAIGLGKKTLLANVCGSLADMVLLSDSALAVAGDVGKNLAVLQARPALGLWLGMLFYMLQIYLDFSAYSDMAIGMGEMIGFHYKENFDYPYCSKSVSEFWRRWHMSLGSFFRDYVYIPLGGNRKGMARTIFNTFVVWFLTGLWHGASWNFVLWGLYFFVFATLERLFLSDKLKKAPPFISRAYLLIVVYFGWILFKFRNLGFAGTVFKGLFGLNGNGFTNFEVNTFLKNNIVFLVVAIIAATPLMKNIGKIITYYAKNNPEAAIFNVTRKIVVPVALLILSTMLLVGDSYNPFLYFQF
ncbi:MAG: MBOAT family protein, partial [Ruminococcus sp.]|nr:MBOAT family protein [Ruminococcus sp.]